MAVVGKSLSGLTYVAVAGVPPIPRPEPSAVFALFPEGAAGARLLDDTALSIRVFAFPELDLQLIFEPTRVRVEALKPKKPEEARLGEYMERIIAALYPKTAFIRYGFNYDIVFQYDAVIPQRNILGAFMKDDAIEDITHFGWQITAEKEKGKRRDTYFFKEVSPLEIQVLANIEFDKPLPRGAASQAEFERCYTEAGAITDRLAFS